jgi:hypothetical protein
MVCRKMDCGGSGLKVCMEGSCECTEQAVADTQQRVVFELGVVDRRGLKSVIKKKSNMSEEK